MLIHKLQFNTCATAHGTRKSLGRVVQTELAKRRGLHRWWRWLLLLLLLRCGLRCAASLRTEGTRGRHQRVVVVDVVVRDASIVNKLVVVPLVLVVARLGALSRRLGRHRLLALSARLGRGDGARVDDRVDKCAHVVQNVSQRVEAPHRGELRGEAGVLARWALLVVRQRAANAHRAI
jgi:hypothetical protein